MNNQNTNPHNKNTRYKINDKSTKETSAIQYNNIPAVLHRSNHMIMNVRYAHMYVHACGPQTQPAEVKSIYMQILGHPF